MCQLHQRFYIYMYTHEHLDTHLYIHVIHIRPYMSVCLVCQSSLSVWLLCLSVWSVCLRIVVVVEAEMSRNEQKVAVVVVVEVVVVAIVVNAESGKPKQGGAK